MGVKKPDGALFTSFRAGVIGLIFLILGFQLALFLYKGAELRILAHRDRPDTVFVSAESLDAYRAAAEGDGTGLTDVVNDSGTQLSGSAENARGRKHGGDMQDSGSARDGIYGSGTQKSGSRGNGAGGSVTGVYASVRKNAEHSRKVEHIRETVPRREVESFHFNPNTATLEQLERLGFSPKQAASIDNYRKKGGRFRRKEDFAKSYVVADSVYRRLEPYIDIPKIDLNKADSAAFDSLPCIGGYFAAKMVSYRKALGGYSCKEQLMEIYHFDSERFNAIKDLVCVSPAPPFRLWTLPADSLRLHPHIRSWNTAWAIILYRDNNPPESLTVDGLESAGVLTPEQAAGLRRCRLAPPR